MMKNIMFIIRLVVFVIIPSVLAAQNTPTYTISHYDSASSGFYFIVPFQLGIIPGGVYQNHMIIDSTGRLVYYKNFPNGTSTGDFKLQPNGQISYSFQGKHFIMDSTFQIIDSVNCGNGITTDVHDFQILPNGHFLLLGIETIQMDLSMYPLFGPNNVPGGSNANVKIGIVQELDAAKNVVFEWNALNYFAFDDIDERHLNNPNVVDWTHCNAVEYDVDGNILLSSRHFNEITKINRSDSSIIWRLGGNANQFTFLNDPNMFKRQHDIRRLPNGNISLFDNGDGMFAGNFHFASAKEYNLDEINLTADMEWSYVDDSSEFSSAMGNFQRVEGGNSVVGYGISDTQQKVFSAVSEAGDKVFELEFDLGLQTYRAFNYTTLPWTLHRPVISCYENNGQLYLDAGAGYGSYLWSTGETSQTIQVMTSDSFFVFVPYGDGGQISSEWVVVDDPFTFCNVSSIHLSSDNNDVYILNPVGEMMKIYFRNQQRNLIDITITDVSGKTISTLKINTENIEIPFQHYPAGIYFVLLNDKVFKIVKF